MSARVDFESLKRPGSPNNCLMAPDGLCREAEPDMASPVFGQAPAALYNALRALMSARKGWTITIDDPGALQLEAIARTKLLKFKDDVAARVLPVEDAPEKARLALYSRSRVGYHDMGTNRKRVERLVEELKQNG